MRGAADGPDTSTAMHPAGSAGRRLLSRLRDIMAGSGLADERLSRIVRLIAAEFAADVCSCYLSRPGDVLELYATVGLNPSAVHTTRLQFSEGLVGLVAASARPIAIDNAPEHPNFAYRPETGEDPYQSFCGVPLVRGSRVRGVLTIQNKTRRAYGEDDIEALQTVAMVVCEVTASGPPGDGGAADAMDTGAQLPARLDGVSFNGGLASGFAVLHRPQVTIREMIAEDSDAELVRLRGAVERMHRALDVLMERVDLGGIDEPRDILETYRMFAQDRGWLGRIAEAIRTGLTAEAAVQRVQSDMGARMQHIVDPYLRERLADFEDLANRLLLHLSGKPSVASAGTIPEHAILVARSIGPAELLEYGQTRLAGLVLEEGATTSHVAIVARALDLPVVGRCDGAMATIDAFDRILVDGDNGQVFVRPGDDALQAFEANLESRRQRRQRYADLAALPSVTRDGVRISLNINAGLLVDLPHLAATGADGVGLYRTEIPFMVRSAYPDVAAQTDLYAQVLEQAGGRPVTFRTLDVGGDKSLPYFPDMNDRNPALGWRALRIGLDRPAMLRQQIRALLHAAERNGAVSELRVLFPMVTDLDELRAARALLERETARAGAAGRRVPVLKVGAMLEVPSLLWQLDSVLDRVDFLAIGSNDLTQYLYAADRDNPRLARRFDPLGVPSLRVFAHVIERSARAGVPVSVCGEMAGRPVDALALIGLGATSLSMTPSSVGPIKEMVRSLHAQPLRDMLAMLVGRESAPVRAILTGYAVDRSIPVF